MHRFNKQNPSIQEKTDKTYKKSPLEIIFQRAFRIVVPLGFEPRLTEPKPAVLPLHNGTIILSFDGANVKLFLFPAKKSL